LEAREQLQGNLRQLEQAVAEAAGFLGRQEDRLAAAGAPWGPKETLAHFLFWHERTCLNVEDVLAGKGVEPLGRPVADVNAEAVAAHREEAMATLVQQLWSLQRRLAAGLEALPDPQAVVLVRADGTKITALERPGVMARHIKSHLEELGST